MIKEHLEVPFDTTVLGMAVTGDQVDITQDDRIVAICERGGRLQRIDILDLPLPKPPPRGADWVDALRHWLGQD